MNKIAFMLGIVFLFTAAAAENYTQSFTVDGWLKMTRFAETSEGAGCTSVTDSCSDTGALLPSYMGGVSGAFTSITLTFENTGSSDRQEVQMTESLSYIPDGAKVVFDPQPAYTDGRTATWTAQEMKAGAKMTMRYTYTAKSNADDFAGVINTQVKAKSTAISFTAPRSAKVGERVLIFAMTSEGTPLSDAKVTITYPDGTIQQVKTDSKGSASFIAAKEGFYTYSVEGYAVSKLASTETAPAEVPAAAAAAVASDGIFTSISGILPALAAIFVIAVVALIAYNFFTSKKDEEEYYAAPLQQPADSNLAAQRPVPEPPVAPHAYSGAQGATYSQQYTFGSQKKADEQKRSSVASQPQQSTGKSYDREGAKSAMRPVIVPPHMLNRQTEKYSERTSSDEDVENELASLEKKAREEGEGATHEEEIENAISELEAIRQKLRERKEQMDSLESRLSHSKKKDAEEETDADSDEPEEPTASRKAPAKRSAPSPRVLPPKGKKLKFATHGVRRK